LTALNFGSLEAVTLVVALRSVTLFVRRTVNLGLRQTDKAVDLVVAENLNKEIVVVSENNPADKMIGFLVARESSVNE
jgi:hypothetical protein